MNSTSYRRFASKIAVGMTHYQSHRQRIVSFLRFHNKNPTAFGIRQHRQASSLTIPNQELVQFHHDERTKVGTITLGGKAKMNPFTMELGYQFKSTVKSINKAIANQKIDVNAIVLQGANGCFSAGGDIQWLKDLRHNPVHINADKMMEFFHTFLCVRKLTVPVIASIEGYAVGAAACVACACDIRVMEKHAKMGFNFTKLGFSGGMGGSHFLPMLVGEGKAAEILLTGKMIAGEEAKEIGLVQRVIENKKGDEVYRESLNVAEEISSLHPVAVRNLMQTLRLRIDTGLEAALKREAHTASLCFSRDDWGEGLNAIVEKRKPSFGVYHDE